MKWLQQIKSFIDLNQSIITLSTVILSLSISVLAVSVSTSRVQEQADNTLEFRVNNNQLEFKTASSTPWTMLFDLSQLVVEDDTEAEAIELRATEESIEWKRSSTGDWNALLSLSQLVGEDGRMIELRSTSTAIEWKYIDATSWTSLIELSLLRGETGLRGATGSPGATGAQGPQGPQGPAGLTPTIGVNGNWYIGTTDTGVSASGSGVSPFILVNNAEDLQAMSECLECSYMLTADIDLSEFAWTPVGTEADPFTGRLYGQGYAIDNLTNLEPSMSKFGLFGVASNIVIQDVYVDNFDSGIVAHNDVAYFIGHLQGGDNHLRNIQISSNDDISGTSGVAYLIGRSSFANVYLSEIRLNGSDVYGSSHVGTLIGMVEEYSYVRIHHLDMSSTDVNATSGVSGGLFGEINDSDVEIFDSVITFDVYADGDYVGGIVGLSNVGSLELINTIIRGDLQELDSTYSYGGGLIGACFDCSMVMQNTHVGGSAYVDLYGGTDHIGGFIGYMSDGQLTVFQSSIYVMLEGRENVGGVLGSVNSIDFNGNITDPSDIRIHQSDFRVRIFDYTNPEILINAGGFVGYAYGMDADWTQVTMDFTATNVSEGQNIGGMIGAMNYMFTSGAQDYFVDNEVDIKNLTILGEIAIQNKISTSNNINVGGIVGHINGNLLISSGSIGQDSWSNSGVRQFLDVTNAVVRFQSIDVPGFYVGGMVGLAEGAEITVKNSDVRSNIVTENEFVGGIVGAGSGMSLRTELVTIEGKLKADNVVGGFIGFTEGINRIVIDYSRSAVIGKFTDIGTYISEGDIYGFISPDTYIDFDTSIQASDGLTNNT
jgi:hypothetical protein